MVTPVTGCPWSPPPCTPPVAILSKGGQARTVDRTEDGVARRQLRVRVDQEELAAVAARACVGHREGATRVHDRLLQRRIGDAVLVRRVLIGEAVPRSPVSASRRVAALQYPEGVRRRQPVARRVVEETLLREAGEVVDRARRLGVVEREADAADLGGDVRGQRRWRGRHGPGLGWGDGLTGRFARGRVRAVGPQVAGG